MTEQKAEYKVEHKKVEDLTPDPQNVNKHTQRGRTLLENSIRRRGIGRGIVAAGKGVENPVIIGGNLTHEVAGGLELNDVIFVHTNGNQLVVTVRDDLEPGSPEAIALGLEDNETGKQSYNPDIDILAAVMADPAMQALKEQDKVLAGVLDNIGVMGISHNGDDKSGSSPWERMNGDASPGVLFTFGDVSVRLPEDVYESFNSKVDEKNMAASISRIIG
jgi:hypothetical protein